MKSKSTSSRVIALIIAALIIAAGVFIAPPDSLGVPGFRAICVLLAAVVLWITEAIPMLMTCLLLVPGFKYMGVLTLKEITAAACSTSVFFLLAGFGIGAALLKTNVAYILLRAVTKFAGKDSGKIVSGFVVLTAIISLIVSNSVAVICVTPIAISVIKAIGDPKPGTSGLAKGLMLGLPFGSMCGGLAMPCSNSLNVTLTDLLESLTGFHVGFLQWTIVGFPLMILMTAFVAIYLPKAVHAEELTDEQVAGFNAIFDKIPSKLETKDWKFLVIVIGMIVFWLASNWITLFDTATVCIIGVACMFLPGIDLIDKKDYMKEFKGLSIILLLCIMPLATAMRNSGAGEWLVNTVFAGSGGWPSLVLIIVITLMAFVIHCMVPSGSGNAALSATLMFPLAYSAGLPMLPVLLILAEQCGNNFMMPIEGIFSFTIGYDHFSFTDCIKTGIPITIFSFLCCVIYLPLVGGLVM